MALPPSGPSAIEIEPVEALVSLPMVPTITPQCRRESGQHALLEARIQSLHRVASRARELVAALYCGTTELSDEEAAIAAALIEELNGLPPASDA